MAASSTNEQTGSERSSQCEPSDAQTDKLSFNNNLPHREDDNYYGRIDTCMCNKCFDVLQQEKVHELYKKFCQPLCPAANAVSRRGHILMKRKPAAAMHDRQVNLLQKVDDASEVSNSANALVIPNKN